MRKLPELMDFIKGPDFPTGGIIMGYSGIRAAYATGRGKIILRAKTEIVEKKNGRFQIVVTELPYMVNKARLLQSIAELVKNKRIDGISDLGDHSDRDGMRMVIDLKRDANPQVVLNQLFRYSQMQDTVGIIMLALTGGVPKIMSLKEILEHYIDFQCDVIRRRTMFDLRKARERAHILKGLNIAHDFIDEVIRIIRASSDQANAKKNLMERCFKPAEGWVHIGEVQLVDYGEDGIYLDEAQASAIVAMRLGQLSGLEQQKIEDEYKALMERIGELEAILSDHQLVVEIIKKELGEIKRKFNDPRRTDIQAISGEVDIEDLIPEEDCVVTATHAGYIKRMPVDVYKTQKRGGRGVTGVSSKEEDFVEELFISSTHDHIFFITNFGRIHRLKCYQIPEGSRTAKGMNIVNLLQLEKGEHVTNMLKVHDFSPDQYLVMVTKQGLIKRTELSAYRNVRKNGLIAITLNEGDELAFVKLTDGEQDLLIATKNGMAIRIPRNGRASALPYGEGRPRHQAARRRRSGRHGKTASGRPDHDHHRPRTGPSERIQRIRSAKARRVRQDQLPRVRREGSRHRHPCRGRQRRPAAGVGRRHHHPHPRVGCEHHVALCRRRARHARQRRGKTGVLCARRTRRFRRSERGGSGVERRSRSRCGGRSRRRSDGSSARTGRSFRCIGGRITN